MFKLKSNIFTISLFFTGSVILAQDAGEIVKKANEKMRGSTFQGDLTIKIVRPDWERDIGVKVWLKGKDYSMILITSPARDKGITYLKRKKEVWNWVPSIEKTIKLPPSMMGESWMGTDFTNDDLVREASVIDDYTHSLAGSETIEGRDCHKIEMIPKPGAAVVWGKVFLWIDKSDYIELKTEFYDEDGYLVNTMNAASVRNIGGRTIPTYFELLPAGKKGNKTILMYNSAAFDSPISNNFFTTQKMKELQ